MFLDDLDLEGKKVLDLGCGEAGCWVDVLAKYPSLELFLFEPDPKVLAKAKSRVRGPNVKYSSDQNDIPSAVMDLVTCFSVLEHVWDLKGFFLLVKRVLKSEGQAILNYDDGHFRNYMYLNRSRFFRFRNSLKTRLYRLWKLLNWYSKYQRPVDAIQLRKIYSSLGFQELRDSYHVIDSFKKVDFPEMSMDEQIKYIELQSALEVLLASVVNRGESRSSGERGHSKLFNIMLSRTVYLVLKKSS
jgi:ubiquinone/menaquinone biosynthesis C-methylase UbiE